ncbi:MAG: GNAT family N-acetyltransferase [Pirellulaceae bacterium]
MTLSIQIVDPQSLCAAATQQWRELAKTPLQSPEWMLNWWAAYQSPNSRAVILLVYNDRDDRQLIGVAPFMLRNCWSFGRVLRFLGSGSACTDYQDLLSVPGREVMVADAVADWLISGEGRRSWDLVELEGVSGQPVCITQLLHRLRLHGAVQQETVLESTWRLDLTNGWEGFMQRMSKSQRSQSRNLINRFDKSDNLTFQVVEDRDHIHAALTICMELHQRRWQSVGKPGCFADRRFHDFILRNIDSFARTQQAVITLLEQDGVPLASQLMFKDTAGGCYLYQTGRDPKFDDARIGQILTLVSIRHACNQGTQFFDYLRGDELYKARLKAQPFACRRIRSFAPGTLPRLRYGAWQLTKKIQETSSRLRKLRTPLVESTSEE